jgi:hypothetical protein
MTAQTKIIDFHNHHIPARFELTATRTQPATQRARWEMLARKLPDEDLLLRDIREGHLAARVVNIPGNLIADENGHVPHQTIKAINDNLAELAARHPGRIYGLASVDGYDGDRSAREAERAITELGLRGLFVDCARGDLLLDAPQARPTLEVAAKFEVPVFAHPIAPEPLTRQMTPYGLIGTLFARGGREWGVSNRAGRRRGILRVARLARGRDRACRRRIGNGCGPVAAEQTPQRHHRGHAQACLHRYHADPSRSDPRLCRCAGSGQCALRAATFPLPAKHRFMVRLRKRCSRQAFPMPNRTPSLRATACGCLASPEYRLVPMSTHLLEVTHEMDHARTG